MLIDDDLRISNHFRFDLDRSFGQQRWLFEFVLVEVESKLKRKSHYGIGTLRNSFVSVISDI